MRSSSFSRHPLGSVFTEMPPATLTILIGCIVLWFVEAGTMRHWPSFWEPWLALSAPGLLAGKIWQLVTYQVLHAPSGIGHILFNMLALVIFGRRLERRWGTGGFVRYFAACGIGGGVVFALVALLLQSPATVVGASGAIFGILMAWALIWPLEEVLVMFVLRMQVRHMVLILVLIDVMSAWLGWLGGSPLGAVAHVGGALTGWAYLAHSHRYKDLLSWRPRPLHAFRRWRARRRIGVVDRDFDAWLKDQDDETRH